MFNPNISLRRNLFSHLAHPLTFERGNFDGTQINSETISIITRITFIAFYVLIRSDLPVTKTLKFLSFSAVIFYTLTAAAKIFFAIFRMIVPKKVSYEDNDIPFLNPAIGNKIKSNIALGKEFRKTASENITEHYELGSSDHIEEYIDLSRKSYLPLFRNKNSICNEIIELKKTINKVILERNVPLANLKTVITEIDALLKAGKSEDEIRETVKEKYPMLPFEVNEDELFEKNQIFKDFDNKKQILKIISKSYSDLISKYEITEFVNKIREFSREHTNFKIKIISILLEYRPFTMSKEEYKEELLSETQLTNIAMIQILYLAGFIKSTSENNFKGAYNHIKLDQTSIDSALSNEGTILSDGYFYSKEDMNLLQKSNRGIEKSSYNQQEFSVLDVDLIRGNITIEQYESIAREAIQLERNPTR
ncbi:MAG: hypothetical protein Tsb0021_01300 [Chlamydiales bacterium]